MRKGAIDTDTIGKFILFVVVLAILVFFIISLMNNSSSLALKTLMLPKLW
ncbi:Uncharacterised protein [uncultured archaeon]|nr:Uncharacterised protein [uncultured archaeon]